MKDVLFCCESPRDMMNNFDDSISHEFEGVVFQSVTKNYYSIINLATKECICRIRFENINFGVNLYGYRFDAIFGFYTEKDIDYLCLVLKNKSPSLLFEHRNEGLNPMIEYVKALIGEYVNEHLPNNNLLPILSADSSLTARPKSVYISYKDYKLIKSYSSIPKIKNVIFNNPATIVLWSDGTKTVVKAQGDEVYDHEKGLAMAIAKKALGNQGKYYNEFDKWINKD